MLIEQDQIMKKEIRERGVGGVGLVFVYGFFFGNTGIDLNRNLWVLSIYICILFCQGSSVRHEILLLATSLQQEDTCWEQRIRCG